ncbi:gluconate:H+ symporter [Pedobacter ginsengisoli]|uniref:gluconate:H+ symporter n=1 Tax=Pedobacter ginsengisoli TaxID=363852 RepID=UPI00254FC70B|nr:gluconate:H+ symporter [Pedobacter ginsengisoli]
MTILIVVGCILLLVLLITWARINPFIAFLIVSIFCGIMLGIPLKSITSSVQKGMGDILGSLVSIIVFGAMLGKLVAESGAAQKIASVMMGLFGTKYIQWGLVLTGFIVGIPLFYNVGFVLMVPLIFSVVYKYKLPAVYIGLPMLAALSVTHGFLPPHPSPAALVLQFNANMGLTLLYGIVLAVPAIVLAGPVYSGTLKNMVSVPLKAFISEDLPENKLPGAANSLLSALLPVILLGAAAIYGLSEPDENFKSIVSFLSEPTIVMLITLIVTTYTLGLRMGKSMKDIMTIYVSAVKDIAMILLIIAGSGALKQVLADSGVSNQIANALNDLHFEPLVLGWLIAALIRVSVGSATVAGLTAAGIIAPVMLQAHTNPNLMVLSIGAGSLMFSHVNDPGFWMFKEYFNLTMKQTILSWSVMETIVAVVGLLGVLLLNLLV